MKSSNSTARPLQTQTPQLYRPGLCLQAQRRLHLNISTETAECQRMMRSTASQYYLSNWTLSKWNASSAAAHAHFHLYQKDQQIRLCQYKTLFSTGNFFWGFLSTMLKRSWDSLVHLPYKIGLWTQKLHFLGGGTGGAAVGHKYQKKNRKGHL